MSDRTILNRISGNGIMMGIPVRLPSNRLAEVKSNIKSCLANDTPITIEAHVINRLVEDMILPEGDVKKRGWNSQAEVINCVKKIKNVRVLRLNINHEHSQNRDGIWHLFDDIAVTRCEEYDLCGGAN